MLVINFILVVLVFGKSIFSLPYEIYPQRKVDSDVEVITGSRGTKLSEKQVVPLSYSSYNPYVVYNYPEPGWRASANMKVDGDISGVILFHQFSPNNFVKVTVNITGFPPGKHAVHIHAFGDLSQGCKSTGPHLQSNFIGNIEVKENGSLLTSFYSTFLTIFGYHGIVGRSIIIHANPIEFNQYPEVYSNPVQPAPGHAVSFQTEENTVGAAIACGIITITDNII